MDTVAFIGPRSVSPEEAQSLRELGRLLAKAGAQLHTAPRTGACAYVADGYRKAGRKPVMHTTGLHEASPWLLMFSSDDEFWDQIVQSYPKDADTSKWDAITSLSRLDELNARLAGVS